MKLHLIRHGQTEANEKRLYCGVTDLPLSAHGAEEIKKLAREGIYPDADLYYTSGLLRADQTLGLIYGGAAFTALPELSEYNFGVFEMRGYEELKSDPNYQAWITDESGGFMCPGGESKKQFEARVLPGFTALLAHVKAQDKSISVITHGGVIVTIMQSLYPSEGHFYNWQPRPGRGYTLRFENGKFLEHEKI